MGITSTPRATEDLWERSGAQEVAGLSVRGVSHAFGAKPALEDVSLNVGRGEIHALLGPNGAGKTTLIRAIVGLLDPDRGEIGIFGKPTTTLSRRQFSKLFGLAPSGDRSFYLRLTGLENLAFFARLHGFNRRDAVARARDVLEAVGLGDVARHRASTYSHGMQKRLSVARAILHEPPVLLIDEATHDLDPIATRKVHDLITSRSKRGVAVLWATQRVDEIRGFANRVTLLDRAAVRFSGTVPELMAVSLATRYLVHLTDGAGLGDLLHRAAGAVDGLGVIRRAGEQGSEHFVLALGDNVVLGDALRRLLDAGINVVSCTQERSSVEEGFLHLTRPES